MGIFRQARVCTVVHFYLFEHQSIILITPVQAFEEKINESMEEELIIALQRLLENDWSYEAEELIFKFRTNVAQTTATQSPIEPETDEQGRQVVEFIGQKKTAIARYGHCPFIIFCAYEVQEVKKFNSTY